jgi:methyltransferase (TIGR00027 family)
MSKINFGFRRRELLALSCLGGMFDVPRNGWAVEAGKPSRTAISVASSRMIGARDPDPATRCPDYLAEKLLTEEDRELLIGTAHYDTFPMSWPEIVAYFAERNAAKLAGHSGWLPHATLNLRTRHLDAAVLGAMRDGTEQIVILGAGLDSRAYRLTQNWTGGRVFEVDFPPTQEYKKRKVQSVIAETPKNLTYVPIDFTKETLDQVLPRHGYQPNAKTLITWEGVTMYLPKAAIDGTLGFAAKHCGPGSSILFDYFDTRLVEGNHDQQGWKAVAKRFAEWGEPWIFGVPNSGEGNIFQLVAAQDLEVQSDMNMGELCVEYLPPKVQPASLGLARWAWRMCHAVQA